MRNNRFSILLRKSGVWLSAFALWALLLWILSGRPLPEANTINLPGFDKILHFVYFLIGAFLGSAAATPSSDAAQKKRSKGHNKNRLD